MKVSIVGTGRIGQFLANVITEKSEFLQDFLKPSKEAVVFLALNENDTVRWFWRFKDLRNIVFTNCSVKARVEKAANKSGMKPWHMHIMFNPVFQRTGNILLVDSPGSGVAHNLLQKLLGMPVTLMQGHCVDCHDGIMSIQQKRFQSDILRIGDYLRAVPPQYRYRTASASRFLEVYERVKSLGPSVLREIQMNPIEGKHDIGYDHDKGHGLKCLAR